MEVQCYQRLRCALLCQVCTVVLIQHGFYEFDYTFVIIWKGETMYGGAWWAAVHGVPKSWARLSDFTFTFYFHALEKEMATHSNILAWRIPETEPPSGLPSMGSHRVGHD